MTRPWQNPQRRGEDWQDRPITRDDREPVYPDGTPKYECWNSGVLKAVKARPAVRPEKYEEDEP